MCNCGKFNNTKIHLYIFTHLIINIFQTYKTVSLSTLPNPQNRRTKKNSTSLNTSSPTTPPKEPKNQLLPAPVSKIKLFSNPYQSPTKKRKKTNFRICICTRPTHNFQSRRHKRHFGAGTLAKTWAVWRYRSK